MVYVLAHSLQAFVGRFGHAIPDCFCPFGSVSRSSGPTWQPTITPSADSCTTWDGLRRTVPVFQASLTRWSDDDTHVAYLHDGRALTLHEAISQHGGEAQANADAFDALSDDDKAALIAFLNTLKAPMRPTLGL